MIARLFLIILAGAGLAAAIFFWPLLKNGPRQAGVIENIDGMPFARADGSILVTEKLAHADIYLQEPVFAKELLLTVSFDPGNLQSLAVGVRENSFWLSYTPVPLPASPAAIRIPLTDKLQEPDRSIDLMFFGEAPGGVETWTLHGIEAQVVSARPSIPEIKDYVKSILWKERAL